MEREIVGVIKGISQILRQQQSTIDWLFQSHGGLLRALQGSPQSDEAPQLDTAASERARAEIERLNALFELGEPPTGVSHD